MGLSTVAAGSEIDFNIKTFANPATNNLFSHINIKVTDLNENIIDFINVKRAIFTDTASVTSGTGTAFTVTPLTQGLSTSSTGSHMAFILGDDSYVTENAGFAINLPSSMFESTVQITYDGSSISRIDIQSSSKIFFRAPSNLLLGGTATIGFIGL
jgi:hypothetical protein